MATDSSINAAPSSGLMDMYVSKVPCDVLPVKPAARAHALMSCTEASS